jgi:hypothetical protein
MINQSRAAGRKISLMRKCNIACERTVSVVPPCGTRPPSFPPFPTLTGGAKGLASCYAGLFFDTFLSKWLPAKIYPFSFANLYIEERRAFQHMRENPSQTNRSLSYGIAPNTCLGIQEGKNSSPPRGGREIFSPGCKSGVNERQDASVPLRGTQDLWHGTSVLGQTCKD